MPHLNLDVIVFGLYLVAVFAVGIAVSRKDRQWDDYFLLAGRQLTWWVIGGSLIAANISTHHFIGMSGQGYTIGLAIASYEWIAAIALIAGPVWASLYTLAENQGWVFPLAFLTRAGIDFLFCAAIIWLLRTRGDSIPRQAVIDRSFSAEDQALMRSIPWWRSFGLWSGLLVAVLVILYTVFF